MRKVNSEQLETRKRRILQAAVHHYIKTGEPAGSKTLVSTYGIRFSSATVRNILSRLEDDGYLIQPHTSSGRVPTDKGYRTYVDALKDVQNHTIARIDGLREQYGRQMNELEDILLNTTKILSALSHYSGFASLPSKENMLIRSVELVALDKKQLLFIFVTNTGLVKHKILNVELSKRNIQYLSSFLKEHLYGATLDDAQRRLKDLMCEIDIETSGLSNFTHFLRDAFFYETDFYLDGLNNVIALPEFRDYNVSGALVSSKGPGHALLRSLTEKFSDDKVNVLIGSETKCKGFECISAVTGVYKKNDQPIGILGIIGPKRMEYKKMMTIVKNVSKILEEVLQK